MSGNTAPATTIGRYTIEAVLGRGAMGVIYKAHDPVIDRKVALKLVNADLLSGEERASYIARFRHEAQAAGRCSHPNIVGVYDYALHEGNPYLAMEFVDGVSLSQLDQAFTIQQSVDLIAQVLDALDTAHELGVVHRDIKPANIMLTNTGWVKVADFGISRIDSSAITAAGSVVGTPAYMSPEQCRGDPVDARSDVFSTGVVLFEMVTGRKPFIGRTPHELWHRLLTEAPSDPVTLRPDLPPALGAIILRSLAKDAADRFASAAAMAAALRQLTGSVTASLVLPPSDATTFQPATGVGVGTGMATRAGLDLDRKALSTLEWQLAHYVGPIAAQLVRRAARTSSDMDALCRTLASAIGDPAGQEKFTQEVQRSALVSRSAILPSAGFTAADLETVQKELARYIGPVARVLVKRATKDGGTTADLWQRLAAAIDKPSDRTAFLRAQPK